MTRWWMAGALGAAATCSLLAGCPDAVPIVVGTGGMTTTTSSDTTSTFSGTTTTNGTGGNKYCSVMQNLGSAVTWQAAAQAPAAMTTGDMNGDGKPDLVISDTSNTFVTVLLNDGNGGFSAVPAHTSVKLPTALVVADLNGDTKADVAAVDTSTSVSILLGNGDGSLNSPTDYGVSKAVAAVAAADLTGDGKPDLVFSSSQEASVFVLLNNGDGTFPQPMGYDVSTAGSVSLAAVDLTGDGNPDLAVAAQPAATGQNGNVFVFAGKGDGTLTIPAVSYTVGSDPAAIVAADLTGDGKLDLAVADGIDGSIDVLLNKGDGTFDPAVSYPAGSQASAIAAVDLDGDGNPDLVAGTPNASGGSTLAVLTNQGQGVYGAAAPYSTSAAVLTILGNDLNGDGKPDLALLLADGKVSVVLNTCP